MNNYITKSIDIETINKNGYEASKDGQVVSHKGKTPRTLKQAIGSHGYPVVNLRIDGKSVLFLVHRLVAMTYLEGVDGKPLVNHKDGNKQNNHVDNLEYVTHSENIQHYYDNKC